MFQIDMDTLVEVGEFGSEAWCRGCADYGVQILQAADIPDDLSWAFSEFYTDPPERMVSSKRPVSGYYFMIENGRVSGGDGVPERVLEVPGFHAKINWAYICNQSRTKYGSAGQRQRSEEERILLSDMSNYVGRELNLGGVPNPVWPGPIVAALSEGAEDGAGLHNIAASMQSPSPEFSDLPVTDLGVPIFSKMSDDQQQQFLTLCAIDH